MMIKFENITETTEPFTLASGTYVLEYAANWGNGSVTLQKLVGSNWVNAMSAFGSDGRIAATNLSGIYRFAVHGATVVKVTIIASENFSRGRS
jgi:hypothetical protein